MGTRLVAVEVAIARRGPKDVAGWSIVGGGAQAGIEKGDIVVAVDCKPIHSATQLRNSVGLAPVGRELRITFARGGVDHTVSVEVAAAGNDNTGTIARSRRKQ
jgi:membrane-associated protease RseP (regulator of RpoE activity)